MKKFFALIIILLSSTIVLAQAEVKLSSDEFLKKLLRGEITMNRDPFFPNVPESARQGFIAQQKQKNPSFREAYWFVPNLKTNRYMYTVFFDWVHQKCLYRAEGWDSKTKKIIPAEIDPTGTVVDKKYCEAAYGIKIGF